MPWPGNPFSPTSFWNTPLPANAPLDPNSQAYVNELVRQVNTYGPWLNTTSYSVPVYIVAANQATRHVTLDTWGPDLQAAFDAVPIPANAQAASGTDEHMVIWQPSTNKMWEFWQMHQEPDGWHARWGGEMDNVSTNPGYFTHTGQTNNWGATATGLPLLGGLITQADLQRGYINHALAISLVETAPATWSWPAQRTDGGYFTPGITPIPEGTRFRLNPNLNIASLHLPTLDRMIAQAAQTYGIVVRDKSGAVTLYGQDPNNLPTNPWPQALDNDYPKPTSPGSPGTNSKPSKPNSPAAGDPNPSVGKWSPSAVARTERISRRLPPRPSNTCCRPGSDERSASHRRHRSAIGAPAPSSPDSKSRPYPIPSAGNGVSVGIVSRSRAVIGPASTKFVARAIAKGDRLVTGHETWLSMQCAGWATRSLKCSAMSRNTSRNRLGSTISSSIISNQSCSRAVLAPSRRLRFARICPPLRPPTLRVTRRADRGEAPVRPVARCVRSLPAAP